MAKKSSIANLAAFLGVLAVVEIGWLAWFLYEPLPNAGNIGGHVRRWIFLGRALPEVIPDVRFEQSYLGLALAELSHVQNLRQRLPIVLGAALIASSGVAMGRLILRALKLVTARFGGGPENELTPWERLPLAFGLGMTGLGVVTLMVGRLGRIGPWPVRLGLVGFLFLELACSLASRRRQVDPEFRADGPDATKKGPQARWGLPWLGFGLVAGPFLVIMALGAMLPSTDFDAIEYHLQGPKEYYQAGRIAFLPHNVYTSMPFGVEMLHLLGMELLDDWWSGALVGQLLVALYAPAAAALIALTARRWASARAAWVAGVVYLTTPWVYRLAVIPYVEGPLCFYHAALVWAAARAVRRPRSALHDWTVIGLLAGGAMACKYPALISAVLPFGLLALVESVRSRSGRAVFAFVLGWAVVMTPWLAKNTLDTGNPVYPLAHRVFGGAHWDADQDAKWSRVHGRGPVTPALLAQSIVDVAGRSDWQSPLFAALAPLALLRPGSRRFVRALWLYVAYLFLTWWLLTHRLDRFWLPLLAPLAVLAGIGADWARNVVWSVLLALILTLSIVTNLAYTSTALAGLNEWTADLNDLRRRVPAMLNPPLARLDAKLPAGSKVLLVGQAAVFHLDHPIVYNTVFNKETIETLTRARTPGQVGESLRRLGVTHVYVDWYTIDRYRSPGNYGFTDYVTPALFDRLVAVGVLRPPELLGTRQALYPVR